MAETKAHLVQRRVFEISVVNKNLVTAKEIGVADSSKVLSKMGCVKPVVKVRRRNVYEVDPKPNCKTCLFCKSGSVGCVKRHRL